MTRGLLLLARSKKYPRVLYCGDRVDGVPGFTTIMNSTPCTSQEGSGKTRRDVLSNVQGQGHWQERRVNVFAPDHCSMQVFLEFISASCADMTSGFPLPSCRSRLLRSQPAAGPKLHRTLRAAGVRPRWTEGIAGERGGPALKPQTCAPRMKDIRVRGCPMPGAPPDARRR